MLPIPEASEEDKKSAVGVGPPVFGSSYRKDRAIEAPAELQTIKRFPSIGKEKGFKTWRYYLYYFILIKKLLGFWNHP